MKVGHVRHVVVLVLLKRESRSVGGDGEPAVLVGAKGGGHWEFGEIRGSGGVRRVSGRLSEGREKQRRSTRSGQRVWWINKRSAPCP